MNNGFPRQRPSLVYRTCDCGANLTRLGTCPDCDGPDPREMTPEECTAALAAQDDLAHEKETN